MPDITLLPADIAALSVAELAALPPEHKHEIDRNINEAMAWLKKARVKLDAALDQCYGQQARQALLESGRDFGTTHLADGCLQLKFELPKKVTWDQQLLNQIAERITESGGSPQEFLDVRLSVSETRYNAWPAALQQQFAEARTVEAGKPSFTLQMNGEAA